MKSILAGLIAGASLMIAATSAMAATVALSAPNYAALAATSSVISGGTVVGSPTVFTGNVSSVVLSPFSGQGVGTPGYYAAGPAASTLPNPIVINVIPGAANFSFLWGSPDNYNNIIFYNGAVATTLASLLPPGFVYTSTGAVFVQVSGLVFDKVTFGATQQAVEFSNVVASVPVPAGLVLLGSGLLGLGVMAKRKKDKAGPVAA